MNKPDGTIPDEVLQRFAEDFKKKMTDKINGDIIGIAMESSEGREDVMVNLGRGNLFMDNYYCEIPSASGMEPISFPSFSMPTIKNPPLRHQTIISYKCCGCSRFFRETDWPKCPHCGAEAGVC